MIARLHILDPKYLKNIGVASFVLTLFWVHCTKVVILMTVKTLAGFGTCGEVVNFFNIYPCTYYLNMPWNYSLCYLMLLLQLYFEVSLKLVCPQGTRSTISRDAFTWQFIRHHSFCIFSCLLLVVLSCQSLPVWCHRLKKMLGIKKELSCIMKVAAAIHNTIYHYLSHCWRPWKHR